MPKPLENTQRYWAYSNYIVSMSRLIAQTYPADSTLAQHMAADTGFAKLCRKGDIERNQVAVLLRHSWFTELLLNETCQSKNLLIYANPWTMVQCYYAVYPSIRAYFAVLNRPVGKTHHAALTTISADLTAYKQRFPPPWSTVLTGDPGLKFLELVNGPTNLTPAFTNPLASPYSSDPWQFYGLLLKTTRTRQLETFISGWKRRNNRQRISKQKRAELANSFRSTTMFDFLYRLRTRSNYQDIDSFAFSNVTNTDALALQQGICQVVYATLFVFDMMIAKVGGKKWFAGLVNEFCTSAGQPTRQTILKRWRVIKDYL